MTPPSIPNTLYAIAVFIFTKYYSHIESWPPPAMHSSLQKNQMVGDLGIIGGGGGSSLKV